MTFPLVFTLVLFYFICGALLGSLFSNSRDAILTTVAWPILFVCILIDLLFDSLVGFLVLVFRK